MTLPTIYSLIYVVKMIANSVSFLKEEKNQLQKMTNYCIDCWRLFLGFCYQFLITSKQGKM